MPHLEVTEQPTQPPRAGLARVAILSIDADERDEWITTEDETTYVRTLKGDRVPLDCTSVEEVRERVERAIDGPQSPTRALARAGQLPVYTIEIYFFEGRFAWHIDVMTCGAYVSYLIDTAFLALADAIEDEDPGARELAELIEDPTAEESSDASGQ